MSLLDKIKAQIQNLIGIANEKTGNTDADLTSAVTALIDGYGGFSYDEIATNDVTGDVILNVDKVNYFAFRSKKITSVIGENVTSLGDECFYATLISFAEFKNIPNTNSIPNSCFRSCKNLKRVDCGNAKQINMFAFHSSSLLDTLILRGSTVCAIAQTNSFDGTCFAAGNTGGTVYVPSDLIETYKTATNWSIFYEQGTCEFVAIEGSEYE